MDPILELKDVSRQFTVRQGMLRQAAVLRAVEEVSLSLGRGETLGLVGESGCGKSTLARMAVRLLRPTSGSVLLNGRSLWDADPTFARTIPRTIQMIFQDPFSSLDPRQNVGSAIAEGLHANRVGSGREREERVRELLEWVGLSGGQARRYPHEFSGGQRQRVAVARALALEPQVIVCDEPVSALDVSIQAQVLNLLKDLQARLGLSYLFISHDLSVVAHVSDRVAVMYLGRLVELAPARDLLRSPRHPYAKALLAAVPAPDPAVRTEPPLLPGDIPSPVDKPAGCPFHPRCPEAFDRCPRETPRWKEIGPDRFTACHLYD